MMEPYESEPRELVLMSEWDRHHSLFPFETDVARLRVTPEAGALLEALGVS